MHLFNYRVKRNKMFQRENRDICTEQEYFHAKFSVFIQNIFLHKFV